MDYEAAMAVGAALAALGGLLERKGICTTTELVQVLGECAVAAEGAGPSRCAWGRLPGRAALRSKSANCCATATVCSDSVRNYEKTVKSFRTPLLISGIRIPDTERGRASDPTPLRHHDHAIAGGQNCECPEILDRQDLKSRRLRPTER